MAGVFQQASTDIGNDTSFGRALEQCTELFRNASQFTNDFIDNSTQIFIVPLTNYIKDVINPALVF